MIVPFMLFSNGSKRIATCRSYLTNKHIFENFGEVNCPVAPFGCRTGHSCYV